jgi:hypothetical protein
MFGDGQRDGYQSNWVAGWGGGCSAKKKPDIFKRCRWEISVNLHRSCGEVVPCVVGPGLALLLTVWMKRIIFYINFQLNILHSPLQFITALNWGETRLGKGVDLDNAIM